MVKRIGARKINYDKVSLPKLMLKEVDRIVQSDDRLGFVSTQEFVKEAVRKSIIYYGGVLTDDRQSSE